MSDETIDLSILDDVNNEESDYLYVSMYEIDRCYGGAEEGGWWYDWMDFKKVVRVFPNNTDEDYETALQYCRKLNEAQRKQDRIDGKRERFSVIGSADIAYELETVPCENQTTTRPHYE